MSGVAHPVGIELQSATTTEHRHQWEHRPYQSGYHVTRYFCSRCGRWGRRTWPHHGQVPPIVEYPARLKKPEAHWGTDDSHVVHIVTKPPRYREDHENPTEWAPPTRLWSWS